MDKIILKDMQFYGYHGLFPEENKLGQRFHVDLELHADLSVAGHSDEMTDSIHYGEVYEAVRSIVEGKPLHLIEAVAEGLAQEILHKFDKVKAVKVRLVKPDAPIPGHLESVAIEILRERVI